MNEYNLTVGKRLREIRESFNEGTKLSSSQFAHLLGTTRDKITNYENGRSSIPISILYSLYQRGINPVYIISGEGNIYADNLQGKLIKERMERHQSDEILNKNIFKLDDERYRETHNVYKSAAGKIKK